MIKDEIKKLKDIDLYSLSMFMLFKFTEVSEFAAISEIPYILDKDNTLRLCQYFGGRTIKIPTIDELYSMMSILLLYQYVNIDGKKYSEAVELIGFSSRELRKVKTAYTKLCKILNNYNIKSRHAYE